MIVPPDASTPASRRQSGLVVENLRVAYRHAGGESLAVDGVGFELPPGEALGVVGESGCGKSTMALAVAGLLRPDEAAMSVGRLTLGEESVLAPRRAGAGSLLGRRIGFVFQNPHVALNPVLTVERQMTDHMRRHLRISRAEAHVRAIRLLEEVGIGDAERRLGSYPHEFSGGMLQRVTIAIALACDPDLLIADEPTTALDATVQAEVVDLISEQRAKRRLSLLWITHDLALLPRIVGRIAVMYAGRIVELGTTEEVYSAPAHPYSNALLASVRSLWDDSSKPFQSVPGAPPAPGPVTESCAFAPRCALVHERCRRTPPLSRVPTRETLRAACWSALPGSGT